MFISIKLCWAIEILINNLHSRNTKMNFRLKCTGKVNRDQEPVNFFKEKVSLQICKCKYSQNNLMPSMAKNVLLKVLNKGKMRILNLFSISRSSKRKMSKLNLRNNRGIKVLNKLKWIFRWKSTLLKNRKIIAFSR